MTSPIIYMIRHGEKPPKAPNGKDVDGLSAEGLSRAQALVQVFGATSPYNIGHIVAEHPKKDGSRSRPYDTILPLAKSLGLKPNISVDRDDADGAAAAALEYKGPGNVLICWEHGQLDLIAQALGVPGGEKYPDDRFDLIWTLVSPYDRISDITSEAVPGLDDGVGNI